MRLLLDIAAFGLGFVNPAGRCGIYRCIDEFLMHREQLGNSKLGLTALRDASMSLLTQAESDRTHPELNVAWIPSWQPTLAPVKILTRIAAIAGKKNRHDPRRWLAAATWRLGLKTSRKSAITGTWDIIHSFSDAIPDITHVHAGIRILTVHDMTPFTHPELHLDVTRQTFAKAIASIIESGGWAICDSESTRRDLLRLTAMPAERIRVILLAADRRFAPASIEAIRDVRERYRIGEHPYLLCLSSVEPRKNVPATLRAFSRLHQEASRAGQPCNLSLVIAGPTGWMSGEFEQELAVTKARVVRTGFIADADLPALYSGCRTFLYLSLAEGFGLPPLEAMSCGAAVLTSNTTSLPEVVGDAGLMVDPQNEEDIVAALHRLQGDDLLIAELQRRALLRAQTFSWQRFTAEHRDLYHELHRRR